MCQENRRNLQISGEIRKSVFHRLRIIVFAPERSSEDFAARFRLEGDSAHEGPEFFH